MKGLNIFWVTSKPDDYGACRSGFVETTPGNAKQYYHHKKIDRADWAVLKKYFSLESCDEESEKTPDERFYGAE